MAVPYDPCIHGPGVHKCGHPDCVGAREHSAAIAAEYRAAVAHDDALEALVELVRQHLPASHDMQTGPWADDIVTALRANPAVAVQGIGGTESIPAKGRYYVFYVPAHHVNARGA